MEPLMGVQEQAYALQPTLHLLVGLLILCLLLLFILNCLLLLRWRLTCRRVRGEKMLSQGAPPASPQLFQVVSGSAVVRQGGGGRVLLQPGNGPAGLPAFPLPSSCSQGASRLQTLFGSQDPPRVPPGKRASQGLASSSSDQDKHPILVPPNTPDMASGTGGILTAAFSSSRHTSTQRKVGSCSRSMSATHSHVVPFECGSSIQDEGQRAQLNSANFTASQGPGLDSDFGASAGVSVRILSSDSERSPTTPLLCQQQSGLFEWDYYDPSYKGKAQLHQQLPRICSKQYWL
ncbi:protein huluwa-like [Rhineura floridana]|uniref:protein huluwa-like n=1 Tax=Rhineura floridana TaxID=261503 RepID=UPI002AC83AFB|nr:protein huluwa-like [Rhineura floridana]